MVTSSPLPVEIENGQVFIQLKATDNLQSLSGDEFVRIVVERVDLELWLHEPMPFILILYDAQLNEAYWVYLQHEFEKKPAAKISTVGRTTTIRIPKANRINGLAVQQFVDFKRSILKQVHGITHHDA